MICIEELLGIGPYSLDRKSKEEALSYELIKLTKHHYNNSPLYKEMLDALNFDFTLVKNFTDLPFLPVRLFKELDLLSVDNLDVIKTMTSSGTTGQMVSKIYLDKETASNQTKVLTKIVANYLGNKRLPMLILDSSDILKNRAMFSARGAGILGFSMFGSSREYAFDSEMKINLHALDAFLNKYKGQRIFIFGFTFMIWEHFYKELKKNKIKIDFSNAILIHGGGWKKLQSESVDSTVFKNCLNDVCNIKPENIHDYYGMVEQTGSIYMECKNGYLHAPIFSDIIIRRAIDFSVAEFKEEGIIQVVSILPKSYPGHVLLTEDLGFIVGEDDCSCGRNGKYFKVTGRIKNAEIRGCSDSYGAKF
jgi:phenylacetate-coenzyme A ligase PaaK-like adenylate-forming protein